MRLKQWQNIFKVCLTGNVYDFSVNYNSVDKSDILNIHQYLVNKDYLK